MLAGGYFRQHHSVEAPDAAAGGGAICVGAATGGRFGAGGFLAAAAGCVVGAAETGRGDSSEALAADDGVALAGGAAARCADPGAAGSGVMMLTAGVEAAVGKSALVGRPVGAEEDSIATGALAGGEFHDGA